MAYLIRLSLLFLFCCVFCSVSRVCAQHGVSINPDGGSPHPSAILDVQSTTQGFLPPRMTSAQRDAIANPEEGLHIYNTDLKCPQYNRGTPANPEWICTDGTNCSPMPTAPQAGIHNVSEGAIEWNWIPVPGAAGYRYGFTSDPEASTDAGSATSFIQSGLTCNQPYSIYVWSYNGCGSSEPQLIQQNTSPCGPCLQQTTVSDVQGNIYPIVEIGAQCWMAANLRTTGHALGTSWCYDNVASNCNTYGRLYDWAAVMQGSSASNSIPSGVQGICPSGWHVPSDAEWILMEGTIDSVHGPDDPEWLGLNVNRGTDAGEKLKDHSTWDGSNSTGFSAIPGGYRHQTSGFILLGTATYFWTSRDDGTGAYRRALYEAEGRVYRNINTKLRGMSLRCVKN